MWVNETILVSAVTLFVKVRSVDPYLMDAKGGQQLNSHGLHSPNRTSWAWTVINQPQALYGHVIIALFKYLIILVYVN